ncbi:hypothetical protein PENANT_c022G01824 [Penicillium antarcticum]|uniref:Uncharacterized protein n=1 Tax=Penicillium antarcticum TaxID=416450 RepID=A0A1V6PZ94_9EURO|nr:hypothetical protein PENANT_c022G01824 [Penicillium antarcticum]
MHLYNVFTFPVVRDGLIANTILVAVATILVILRFVSRHIRKSKIWWDDAFCVAAMLHTYGMLAMHYLYARLGMRHNFKQIPPENTVIMLKLLIVYQLVYYNAMVLAKFSYLFLYLRIFVTPEFRILTWVCMGCAAAYWTGSVLQVFLLCTPFQRNWNPTLPGHCGNQNVAFTTIGVFNLLTDVMIMILPIRFIWKLQMSIATKMALYSIFGLGIFISSITIIRIKVLTAVDFLDLPYSMIWAAFWSVTEPALATANGCAPMLRPILKAAFPSLFNTAKAEYATQPASGPILSKSNTSKRIDEMDTAKLGPGFIWCEFARLTLTIVLQSFNWLLLNPKDVSDLPVEAGNGFSRIYYVVRLFYQPRGINTPWQIRNAPQQPAYYHRRGLKEPSRGRFLLRQLVIALWQYLALDLFATLALKQALEQEKHGALPLVVQWDLSVEQWIERVISNLVAGFVVSRILIDFHHRAFSIIVVGLWFDSPSNCPPLFGKAGDASTMRGFWAKFWHQLLQQPLTSMGTFVTRDLLCLPSRSPLERYTNVFVVFFLSGGLHVVLDFVQGIPMRESGAVLFFAMAPLGLLIEDGIKALWKSQTLSGKSTPRPMWQKTLDLLWAMAWLGVTSTWYFYPQMLRPQNQALVPFTLAHQVPLPVLAGVVLFGGVMIAFVFEAEV